MSNKTQGVDRSPIKSALVFLGLFAAFEATAEILYVVGAFALPTQWTAWLTCTLARATGVPAVLGDAEVYLANHTLVIQGECLGIFLIAAYAALVLASFAAWREKAVGLGIGTAVILTANVARLLIVAQTSEHAPRVFTFLHDYVYQVFMVLLVVGTWAWWLARVGRRGA